MKRILGWNEYTLHFVARFNRSFESMGGWQGSEIIDATNEIRVNGDSDIGAFVKFTLGNDPVILMKTGISYVSTEQARLNMETEMDKSGWDFDAVHRNAQGYLEQPSGKDKSRRRIRDG